MAKSEYAQAIVLSVNQLNMLLEKVDSNIPGKLGLSAAVQYCMYLVHIITRLRSSSKVDTTLHAQYCTY